MGIGAFMGPLSSLIDVAGSLYAGHQSEVESDYLRSTAMQARVGDLQRAGLNPMLAAGSMGAASAPPVSYPNPGEAAIRGFSASAAARQADANARLTEAQIGLVNSQHDEIDSRVAQNMASAAQAVAQSDFVRAQLPKLRAEIENIRTETDVNSFVAGLRKFELSQQMQLLPYVLAEAQARGTRAGAQTWAESGVWGKLTALIRALPGAGAGSVAIPAAAAAIK